MLLQGSDLSDAVLGIGTPGRAFNRGGVYFYDSLTSTSPQVTNDDTELGLTKDDIMNSPNVPSDVLSNDDTLYGEWGAASVHFCYSLVSVALTAHNHCLDTQNILLLSSSLYCRSGNFWR